MLDEWYPLLPSSHAKVEIGSVRVRSKFTVSRLTNVWHDIIVYVLYIEAEQWYFNSTVIFQSALSIHVLVTNF